jgi:hypothetical protein
MNFRNHQLAFERAEEMRVKVKFRFNAATGQVEQFEVDDIESSLADAEHNREHDRIAAEIGGVIERRPRVIEQFSDALGPVTQSSRVDPPTDEETVTAPNTLPQRKQ